MVEESRRCSEPAEHVSSVRVAILVMLAALFIYYITARCLGTPPRESFVSGRAHDICRNAKEVFESAGGDTYSAYKQTVPDADPVQHRDVRDLFDAGKLTPQNVQDIM